MVFGRKVRGLLRTRPISLSNVSRVQVLTQLQSKDVLMYLAAIKSFAARVPIQRVFVLDDGSLSHADRQLLESHIPALHWLEARDHQIDGVPVGGTWERLIAIARLSENNYLVQLDADTLALGPLQEVVDAVEKNQAFTIGTWDGQEIEAISERTTKAKEMLSKGHRHVQVVAEANFDRLRDAERLRYIRGCSGFAGFPPTLGRLHTIREISRQMEAVLGSAWKEWGSEQVMSNILVANAKSARVLPHPAYADCTKMRISETRFVHFIGTCRFRGGHYADMIRRLDLARTF